MLSPSPEMALVRRDFIAVLRKKRTFTALLVVTLAAAVVVMLDWPQDTRTWVIAAQGARISDYLSRLLAMVLLAGGLLAITPLAGAAITSEREEGTLPLLRMALLRPSGILWAKLVNLMGFYTLLVVGSLPIFGLIFFLVGVSWSDLSVRLLVVYMTVSSAACCGLYCSVRFGRTVTGVAMSVAGVLALNGLVLLLMLLVTEVFSHVYVGSHLLLQPEAWVYLVAEAISDAFPGFSVTAPVAGSDALVLLASIASPLFYIWKQGSALDVINVGLAAAAWQGLLGVLLLILAAVRLAHAEDVVRLPKNVRVLDAAALEGRRRQFPYYLIDPLKAYPPIADARNPVMMKELRWGMLGRMTTMVRVGYGVLIVDLMLVSYFAVGVDFPGDATRVAGLFVICASCLFAPLLLANIFTKEYEQDNIDMLRMTLVPAEGVTRGKLLGGALALVPLVAPGGLLLVLVGVLYVLFGSGLRALGLALCAVLTLLVFAWCCLTLSLLASLMARRTGTAFLLSYALCLLLLVVPGPAAVYVRGALYPEYTRSPAAYTSASSVADYATYARHRLRALQTAATASPLTSYYAIGEASRPGRQEQIPLHGICCWAASMVLFAGLGLCAYGLAVRLFTRRFLPG